MQTAFYSLVLLLCSTLYTYSQYSEIVKLDTSTYPQMKAEYLVFDKQGNVSTDGRFELYENGSFKKIKKHTPPQEIRKPLSVLIVLDMSCRYDGIDGTPLQKIAQQWLEYIHPDDEIGIVVHDIKNTLVADYTNNTVLLSEKLKTIETHPTDQRKESTPNDTLMRARNLVTKAKNKAIIIFISQSFTPRYTNYWIETDSTIPTYTINTERITADYIRQVSEETGGRNFNRTWNNTNLLYSRILYEARGGKPGMIEWDGEIYCEDGKKKLELYEAENKVRSSYDFYPSLRSINELHFSNEAIRFGGIEPGQEAKKEVVITSTRRDLLIKNIHSRNPQYRIEPRSVFIEKGKTTVFTIYYKSEDSNYTWTRFSAESDECAFTFDASAGYPSKLPKKNELRIVYPTEKDTIYYGEDFDIIWDGIADFEEVELYEHGKPYVYESYPLAHNAKHKYRYIWEEFPFTGFEMMYPRNNKREFHINFSPNSIVKFPFNNETIHYTDYKINRVINSRYKVMAYSGRLVLWDVLKQKQVNSFPFTSIYSGETSAQYLTPHISPSGRYMGYVSSNTLVPEYRSYNWGIWDLQKNKVIYQATYEPRWSYGWYTIFPRSVVFSRDENKVLVSFTNTQTQANQNFVYDIRSGAKSTVEYKKGIKTYSYSPSKRFIAVMDEDIRKLKILESENFKELLEIKNYYNNVTESKPVIPPLWLPNTNKVLVRLPYSENPKDITRKILFYDVETQLEDSVEFLSEKNISFADINPIDSSLLVSFLRESSQPDSLYIVEYHSGKILKKIPIIDSETNWEEFPRWLNDGIHIIHNETIFNIITNQYRYMYGKDRYAVLSPDKRYTVKIEKGLHSGKRVEIGNAKRESFLKKEYIVEVESDSLYVNNVIWTPDSKHLLMELQNKLSLVRNCVLYRVETKERVISYAPTVSFNSVKFNDSCTVCTYLQGDSLMYCRLDTSKQFNRIAKGVLKVKYPINYDMYGFKTASNIFSFYASDSIVHIFDNGNQLLSFKLKHAGNVFWNPFNKDEVVISFGYSNSSLMKINVRNKKVVGEVSLSGGAESLLWLPGRDYFLCTTGIVSKRIYKIRSDSLIIIDSIDLNQYSVFPENGYRTFATYVKGKLQIFDISTFAQIPDNTNEYYEELQFYNKRHHYYSSPAVELIFPDFLEIKPSITTSNLIRNKSALVSGFVKNISSKPVTLRNIYRRWPYSTQLGSSVDVELVQNEYTLDENEYADMRVVVKSPDFVGGENVLCFMANNIHYVRTIEDSTTEISSVDFENEKGMKAVLAPNPSSEKTNIHIFNNIEKHIDITVCDIWGNQVLSLFSGILMEGNINFEIPKLHTGNYFVVVKSSDKSKVYPFVVTQ